MAFSFIPPDTVSVPEIPYQPRVELPAGETALVVVDMQNDFVKEEGTLRVPAAQETVAPIQKLLRAAREAGVRIAFTQDTQVEGDPEFEIWPKHCLLNTWGWKIIDELSPQADELICQKNRYDGFYGSWLGHFLGRIWKVGHVVVVGTVSNICVLHTAASAGLRWYHVVMPANCVSALTVFDQALTLRQVSSLYGGAVLKSAADIRFSLDPGGLSRRVPGPPSGTGNASGP
jgi:nicotinamidase-related amidase